MKKLLLLLFITLLQTSFGSINQNFQKEDSTNTVNKNKSANYIIFDPAIDILVKNDPRVKAIAYFALKNDAHITLEYYSQNSMRFVNQLNQILTDLKVNNINMVFKTNQDYIKNSLVRVYIQK